MYHRRPSLFWPIILIGVGVIFLLNNLGIIQGNPWALIVQFWPVLLIVIGLDILFGRRTAAGSVISATLAVLVIGGVIWLLAARPHINLPGVDLGGELTRESISHPLGDIQSAEVSIDFSSGENRLYALGDSPSLIEGDLAHYGQLRFSVSERSGNAATVRLGSERRISIVGLATSEDWQVGLNTRPTYDLEINLGMGHAELDLSRFKLSGGRVNAGVGSAEVNLPATGKFRLRIDGGVGSLRIVAPSGLGLRAEVNTGVGSFNAGSRLRTVGADVYETEGFSSAENAITLDIDIGVGSVTIDDGG